MSWNNVLPWWVYESSFKQSEALSLGAMPNELWSGSLKCLPSHVVDMHHSSFKYWEGEGYKVKYFDSLIFNDHFNFKRNLT